MGPALEIAALAPRQHDTPVDRALELLPTHAGSVLVDLDETLYLSNSTEDFISLAVPGVAALAGMRLLDLLRPWRWTGGEVTRDVWRVWLTCLLFPWTCLRWKRRVASLARAYRNDPLIGVLQQRSGPTAIVTIGFVPIVRPLLEELGFGGVPLVASRLGSFSDRRRGKLMMVIGAIGQETVRSSLVVSDSADDQPLFEACAVPLRVEWPGARYRRALSNIYFPGEYISRVKRPGEHYFRRAVLQEDFAYWVLTSVALALTPVAHACGLLLLLCSFWIIYERGYVDNDLMALSRENEPKLSKAFFEHRVATPRIQPWMWAAVIAVAGLTVLRWPGVPTPGDFIKWGAVLAGTYAWFLIYNRSAKDIRPWLYSVLQLSRVASFVLLVPVLPIGGAMLGANVLARWTPYYLYRLHDGPWSDSARVGLIRLLFFLVLSTLLITTNGISQVSNLTFFAVLAWTLLRARHDLRS